MTHVPHELMEEFPASASAIHALKVSNAHFAAISARYHDLNQTIYRMETNVEPADDFTMETLKKERLKLADEIAAMLRAKADWFNGRQATQMQAVAPITRTPYFCSGCPHNTSTKVPEGSKALAGITSVEEVVRVIRDA